MNEAQVIDAIAADLNSLALPAHTTIKYVEPRALRGDLGRQLAVYAAGINPEIIATMSSYENKHLINIVWAVPVFTNAESNIAPDAIATAALAEAKLITDRLESWGCEVPGFPQYSAVLTRVRYETGETGFLWQAVFTMSVEAFA